MRSDSSELWPELARQFLVPLHVFVIICNRLLVSLFGRALRNVSLQVELHRISKIKAAALSASSMEELQDVKVRHQNDRNTWIDPYKHQASQMKQSIQDA